MTGSVEDVVLGELEVPDVEAVAAAVGDDVTDLPAELGIAGQTPAGPAAVDALDLLGGRHGQVPGTGRGRRSNCATPSANPSAKIVSRPTWSSNASAVSRSRPSP